MRTRLAARVGLFALGAALALGGAAGSAAAAAEPHYASRERMLMGTRFQILARVAEPRAEAALEQALDRVAALEQLWSPWIVGSEVQRINAHAGGEPVAVGAGTFALLERTLALCRATDRAFDPTFFPLTAVYDLRDPAHFRPPSAEDLARIVPLVDCRQVELDPARTTVRLARHGMGLHLGANAKGTALDEAARVLEAAGVVDYVVDGGGDIVARGQGPHGPWRVGIQDPRGPRGTTVGVVATEGGGVATSGDYERFAEVDGVRYSHIVVPRTGEVARGCMSATVVVPRGPRAGEVADGWATVMCVLGPERAFPLLLAAVPGASAAVITPDGVLHRTMGFKAALGAPGSGGGSGHGNR